MKPGDSDSSNAAKETATSSGSATNSNAWPWAWLGSHRCTIHPKSLQAGYTVNRLTYMHRASQEQPQYVFKSEKTDHIAIHKGRALKHVKARTQKAREKGS
jgi:Hypervirulence associated proteins TUDOR domain